MRFVMAGRTFTLEDLSPAMDKAFLNLYAAFLNGSQCNMTDFDTAAVEFFSAASANPASHDKYFNNFTTIWRWFLEEHSSEEAESLWELALQPALAWERQNEGGRIHKGTPFYLWGVSAILRGDLDMGYSFLHQALEEDAVTFGSEVPDTPALAFVTLNYTKVDPAFRQWPLIQAEFLNNFLAYYRAVYPSHLTLEDFRRCFLANMPRRDAVFMFAYALARLLCLDKVPDYALASSFAGQLEINLLFDVALVIDGAIKAKNPDHWQFIDHAAFLSQSCGLGITKKQFQSIGLAFRTDFDAALDGLLDGSLTLPNGAALSIPARDLSLAYALRNHGAHDVSSVPTVRRRFKEIRQGLFNALFLCVEALY